MSAIQVRMAERSKAPDSSQTCAVSAYECSGLHLEAWVRIPLLTNVLATFSEKLFRKMVFQCRI